jgi:hypothetical protein
MRYARPRFFLLSPALAGAMQASANPSQAYRKVIEVVEIIVTLLCQLVNISSTKQFSWFAHGIEY